MPLFLFLCGTVERHNPHLDNFIAHVSREFNRVRGKKEKAARSRQKEGDSREMITKLRGQRFKGYDEYLLDDGSITYHDVDSGEDVGGELREVPVGSLVLTPKQLAAQQAYKERGQKMAAQKKELGEYVYTHSSEGAFGDLSADTMARAAFLSTYVSFGTDELWRTRYKRLFRKELPSIMRLSKPTADRFWRDVKDKYFRMDNDKALHTVGQSFIKGKLNAPSSSEYQKLYIATLRELYEKIPITQHKRLGYAIKMLSYLNFEFNILCHNPMETVRDEIIPMTVSEFCEIVGHDKTHAADLAKEYGRLTFTVKERKEVFCKFVFNGSDTTAAHIYINPRLVYKGSDFHKVDAIGISFAADSKPIK